MIEPTSYELRIYNRWGEEVFLATDPCGSSEDECGSWDGTYRGKKTQDGTYNWYITYVNATTGQKELKIGHVNLIR
jgi:hypothetical protein